MRMCDLKEMEVINECDCKRLGFVSDIVFNICTGCIEAIIIPGCPKIFGLFGVDSEYIIPIRCIKQIGTDVILVAVCEDDVLIKC